MSRNWQWQKHQANERVQARLNEAEQHRRAKQANGRSPLLLSLLVMIPALVGLIAVIWLLMS